MYQAYRRLDSWPYSATSSRTGLLNRYIPLFGKSKAIRAELRTLIPELLELNGAASDRTAGILTF
jgi:hypothetical protein